MFRTLRRSSRSVLPLSFLPSVWYARRWLLFVSSVLGGVCFVACRRIFDFRGDGLRE